MLPRAANSAVTVSPESLRLTFRRWPTLAAAGLLALAALAAWSNSFSGVLVFDDTPAIVDNPTIRHLWPPGAILSPGGEGGTVGGRPVVNLSLAFNYAISGTSVWSYHVFNLLIHVLAALALFGIVRRTLMGFRIADTGSRISRAGGRAPEALTPNPSATPGHPARFLPLRADEATWLGFAVALLWMLHPLQTEAVTYIVQRAESLMGLCYLLTLYCFIRGAEIPWRLGEAEAAGFHPNGWLALSIFCCLLGMASKEVMASAPLLVLLYDRTFVSGTFRAAWARRRTYYLALGATWLLLGCLIVHTQSRGGSAGFATSVAWWTYALTQCRALVLYLRLCFWPHPLVFDYGDGLVRSFSAVVPQGLFLALLLAGTGWALRRKPALGFLGAWFFLILAPSSSIVPVVTQTMAEHRMYLPLAAVVALAVLGLRRWLRRTVITVALAACLAVALGLATFARNRAYRSEFALWSDTARAYPAGARAHNNVGSFWLKQRNYEAAIRCFHQALQIEPNYASAHYNLGLALFESGRPAQAIPEYEAALRVQPASADIRINLATALLKVGRPADARSQLERALKIQPESADVEYDLAIALDRLGQPQAALAHYEAAARLAPDSAAIQDSLGRALEHLGRTTEAAGHFAAAARLQPDNAETHFQTAESLQKQGHLAAAEREYREALRLQPDRATVRFALGNLLARTGRLDGAIAEYREVLRLAPDRLDVRNNLGNALLMTGRVDEAISVYEDILRRQPDNLSVRRNLEKARELQQAGKTGS